MDTPFDVTNVDHARQRLVGVYLKQQNQEPCDEEWRMQRDLGWTPEKCREKAVEYRKKIDGGGYPVSGNAIATAIHAAFDHFAGRHRHKTIDELRAEIRQKMAGWNGKQI